MVSGYKHTTPYRPFQRGKSTPMPGHEPRLTSEAVCQAAQGGAPAPPRPDGFRSGAKGRISVLPCIRIS